MVNVNLQTISLFIMAYLTTFAYYYLTLHRIEW